MKNQEFEVRINHSNHKLQRFSTELNSSYNHKSISYDMNTSIIIKERIHTHPSHIDMEFISE